jgi:hypothetical protein
MIADNSMAISLVQRAVPRGVLHVWIAVDNRTAAPPLAWTLDGAVVVPRALRAIESARTAQQTPIRREARAFVGLYELADPNPQLEHLVAWMPAVNRRLCASAPFRPRYRRASASAADPARVVLSHPV